MISPLPRPGFKTWATLATVAGGIIFSFVAMSLLVFLYTHTEGSERTFWSTLILSIIVIVLAAAAAQVWTICTKERLLFEERIDRFKERHPKGVRFARCWLFSSVWLMLVALCVRISWMPGNGDHNFVVGSIAILAVALILLHAVMRTRKIMRRRRSRHYDYYA